MSYKITVTTKDIETCIQNADVSNSEKQRFLQILASAPTEKDEHGEVSPCDMDAFDTEYGLNIIFQNGENMILRGVTKIDLITNKYKKLNYENQSFIDRAIGFFASLLR